MFRAWHQQPHLRPHPWKYGLSAPLPLLLHNISLRGEAAFFFLQPFSNEKNCGHLAGAKDEVIDQSVPTLPASQAAFHTRTHTHTHTEQHCLLYRSSLTLGACGYIMDLVELDDTWRWYFCLEGSVNEDVKLCWSSRQTFTFPPQHGVAARHRRVGTAAAAGLRQNQRRIFTILTKKSRKVSFVFVSSVVILTLQNCLA